MEALVARCDDEDAVRASACWSLANCCDLLTPRYVPTVSLDSRCSRCPAPHSNVLALEVTPLLTVALGLAMSSDGEKVRFYRVSLLLPTVYAPTLTFVSRRFKRTASAAWARSSKSLRLTPFPRTFSHSSSTPYSFPSHPQTRPRSDGTLRHPSATRSHPPFSRSLRARSF